MRAEKNCVLTTPESWAKFEACKMHLSPPSPTRSLGSYPFYGGGSVVFDILSYVSPIICGGSVLVYVLVCITLCPSFAIILTMKSELVALLLLSFGCLLTVNILWLFLTVPWVGLQFVIVVFPDHTHLLFYIDLFDKQCRKPVPTATQEKKI